MEGAADRAVVARNKSRGFLGRNRGVIVGAAKFDEY